MESITKRQHEIIAAAGRILTASGVGGLTTKRLAEEMHFSESAIYRHFAGKEQIIVAMLQYLAVDMDARYTEVIRGKAGAEQKFIALFQSYLTFFKTNPHFVAAVFSDGLLEESQRINEAILEIMQVMVKHLQPVISEGQEKGVFTAAVPTDDLLNIVMGSFRLLMFKWRAAGFAFDIEARGQGMITSILALIKHR